MDVRQVFFEMGNGELFSLYEAPQVSQAPETAISSVLWPAIDPESVSAPHTPQKMDHLSFNVDTNEDVHWFRQHLADSDIPVSDVTERRGANGEHRFITSIYFYDPSGNPLEISTFAPAEQEWAGYDFSTWFLDQSPVEALVQDTAADTPTLTPRFI
jgi:catechol 2,3-dioxygenase-like lactoylglutathione lyase family enzyme